MLTPAKMTFISGMPLPSASLEMYSPIEAASYPKKIEIPIQTMYPVNQSSPYSKTILLLNFPNMLRLFSNTLTLKAVKNPRRIK